MTTLAGACHCGAVTAVLESADPAALQVRACQCGFCRRHGAKTVADPAGRLALAFAERDVRRYRFGLKTADFLLCATCGDYVAAVMDDLAVLNVVAVDLALLAARAPDPVDYGAETAAQRIARRRARWMPVVLEIAA